MSATNQAAVRDYERGDVDLSVGCETYMLRSISDSLGFGIWPRRPT